MNGDEVARIERAMRNLSTDLGSSIDKVGDKVDALGERTAITETRLEDHVKEKPTQDVNPWKLLAYVLLGIGGAGAAGGGVSQLF